MHHGLSLYRFKRLALESRFFFDNWKCVYIQTIGRGSMKLKKIDLIENRPTHALFSSFSPWCTCLRIKVCVCVVACVCVGVHAHVYFVG